MSLPKHETTEFSHGGPPSNEWIVVEFRRSLNDRGVRTSALNRCTRITQHFLHWMDANGLGIEVLDHRLANRFLNHDCTCPEPYRYRKWDYRDRGYQLSLFLRFLVDAGYLQFPPEIATGVALVERFGETLVAQGYLPPFIELNLGRCRHFITWLYLSDIPVTAVDMAVAEDFLRHDCQCMRSVFFRGQGTFSAFCNRDNHSFTRLFIAFLAGKGIVASPASPEPGAELDPNIAAFCDWLRQHRGLRDKTVYSYGNRVSALFAEIGTDPGYYDAALIRDALSRCLKTRSRGSGSKLASVLRMYLRYLAVAGLCPPGLVNAVPTISARPFSTLPRYVCQDDIERIIASCDVTTPGGLRDRAILLLLARLGLRAGDIVTLCLGDIDWNSATISVKGKSKYPARLPLPQDAGDAVADYILEARPRVDEDKVFLRNLAPRHLPFASSAAISMIVRRAMRRTGIDADGLPAAHVFRHSIGTNLLRSGTPLEVIGTLLRHQAAAHMKELAERFAGLRNAVICLPANPSFDDRAALRHRLLHLETTLMSARASLDDIAIAIVEANDAAR